MIRANAEFLYVKVGGTNSTYYRDYWVFGLRPSSSIVNNKMFLKLDRFPSAGEGVGDTYSVGSARKKANLNHWTSTYCVSDRQCSYGINIKKHTKNHFCFPETKLVKIIEAKRLKCREK
jgi:hypothetical protein